MLLLRYDQMQIDIHPSIIIEYKSLTLIDVILHVVLYFIFFILHVTLLYFY